MTKLVRRALVLASLLATLAIPTVANAATPAECQASIDALAAQTASTETNFLSKQADKERAGLLGKLAGATETLTAGKTADTVKKLTDFSLHVATLGETGKLEQADAAGLVQAADAAIACVSSIGV